MTQREQPHPCAAVVGAVNMDIGGRSDAALVNGDSNPGQVRVSLGGVGRNIAHNLALLGVDTRLVTAFGDDLYARQITASCAELGIDISQSLTVPGCATSAYLFIAGPDGDMALAVSDMTVCDHLTPDFLSTRLEYLNSARLVVVDTNIPAETIIWLAENVKAPLFADPVSAAKAGKLKSVLGKLHTLKPNRLEAELLSGVAITGAESLERAAAALLDTGLQRVFISLGSEGVYAAEGSGRRCRLPCFPGEMVNTTGCGDAFMAALAWAWLEGAGLEGAAMAGLAASAIAMESPRTINSALSAQAVKDRANL